MPVAFEGVSTPVMVRGLPGLTVVAETFNLIVVAVFLVDSRSAAMDAMGEKGHR